MSKIAMLLIAAVILLAACAEAPLPPGEYQVIPLQNQPITPGVYRFNGPQGEYIGFLGLTPTPLATVTQEATQLPPTTPGTAKQCELKIAQSAINIRGDRSGQPNPNSGPFGQVRQGVVLRAFEFAQTSSFLWALINEQPRQWIAIRTSPGGQWWVNGVEGTTATCVDLPGWPADLEPPPVVALTAS
jgi:hypothetical protein